MSGMLASKLGVTVLAAVLLWMILAIAGLFCFLP